MASQFSYTERKRIRKSFGTRENVLTIPYLLTDAEGCRTSAFLQKPTCCPSNAPPKVCKPRSLSAFPIVSHNGFVEMKFVEYNLAKPAFDVRECQTRGLTFASAVRAKRAADHLRP
jgi:DNA-directed RNA polymerase subunit beta